MGEGSKYEDLIAELLTEAGIPFDREASLSGVRPDFLIRAPNGAVIVVEAKEYRGEMVEVQVRAYEVARYYKDVLGADRAFVVLPGLRHGRLSEGVVTESQLLRFLRREFEKPTLGRGKEAAIVRPSVGRDVFAAMPFGSEYNDVFFVAMAGACQRVGAVCRRVDQEEFAHDIVVRIEDMVRNSVAVIADLSEAEPNVLYEVGFAHALGRPTVHITSTPLEQLPFDVRNWNTLLYSRGQTYQLIDPLATRLAAVLP